MTECAKINDAEYRICRKDLQEIFYIFFINPGLGFITGILRRAKAEARYRKIAISTTALSPKINDVFSSIPPIAAPIILLAKAVSIPATRLIEQAKITPAKNNGRE